jgi:hypothetical protein
MATSPYRPTSGTEGADFMEAFCDRCTRDAAFRAGTGDSCPIAADTMVFAVTDPEYPAEWVQDERGPRCTAFDPETPSAPARAPEGLRTSPGGGE